MFIIIIIIIISKFIKRHVCLQKVAQALVRYRSDGLVTAIKQECLKMSFKTMFRIANEDNKYKINRSLFWSCPLLGLSFLSSFEYMLTSNYK